MQQDFHYNAIYVLAETAGFAPDEAAVIAYASQYVDDATESEPVDLPGDQVFDTTRTAHVGLESFDWNVQKKIYMPFHFLPNMMRRGNSGGKFSYVTRPADDKNNLAARLFATAMAEPDDSFRLIRIGVALHTMADTFAHAGFSGRHNDENNVEDIELFEDGEWDYKLADSMKDILIPRIGHAEALNYPDIPSFKWRYKNDDGKVVTRDNPAVFDAAAECALALLAAAAGNKAAQNPSVPPEMGRLFRKQKAEDPEDRCKAWHNKFKTPKYNPVKWRADALRHKDEKALNWNTFSMSKRAGILRNVASKKGFDNSKWAMFHRAAHLQRALVLGWIN